MSSHKNNKAIKISGKVPDNGPIKATQGPGLSGSGRILFSFRFFNGESVRVGDFNNYYANSKDAQLAAVDLFSKMKNYSAMKMSEVSSGYSKRQLHCNRIDEAKNVVRIEKILREGYKVPERSIKDYEGMYHEIGLADGGRIIAVQYQNVFDVLFVDCNHLVCNDSARFAAAKANYNYPSLFGGVDSIGGINRQCETSCEKELMSMVMRGEFSSIKELIEMYEAVKEDGVHKS